MAPSHHPFEHRCCDSLALAERPHILNPEVEKEQLFGLPVQQKTTKEHNVSRFQLLFASFSLYVGRR